MKRQHDLLRLALQDGEARISSARRRRDGLRIRSFRGDQFLNSLYHDQHWAPR